MTAVPSSVRAIFERFPLVIYPPAAPQPSNACEGKEFQVTIYLSATSSTRHSKQELAIDPNALYIQNCLKLCQIPYKFCLVTCHASPSGRLPFLIARYSNTSENKRLTKSTFKLYEFLPLQRDLSETISDIISLGNDDVSCANRLEEESVSDEFFIVSCLETFDTAWKASLLEKCNRKIFESSLAIPSHSGLVSRYIIDSQLSNLCHTVKTRLYPMNSMVSPFTTVSSWKRLWLWNQGNNNKYTLSSDCLAKILSHVKTILDALQVRLGEDHFFTKQPGHLDMLVSSFVFTIMTNCSIQSKINQLVTSNDYTRLHDHSRRVIELLY